MRKVEKQMLKRHKQQGLTTLKELFEASQPKKLVRAERAIAVKFLKDFIEVWEGRWLPASPMNFEDFGSLPNWRPS